MSQVRFPFELQGGKAGAIAQWENDHKVVQLKGAVKIGAAGNFNHVLEMRAAVPATRWRTLHTPLGLRRQRNVQIFRKGRLKAQLNFLRER
jgi:DNA-binding transcriptional regulator LsrR (DeoR family)